MSTAMSRILFSSLFSFSFFDAHGCAAQNWSHSGLHRDRRCDKFFGPAFSSIDTYVISLHPLPFLVCNLISGQEGGGGLDTWKSVTLLYCNFVIPLVLFVLNSKVSRGTDHGKFIASRRNWEHFGAGYLSVFRACALAAIPKGCLTLRAQQTTISRPISLLKLKGAGLLLGENIRHKEGESLFR